MFEPELTSELDAAREQQEVEAPTAPVPAPVPEPELEPEPEQAKGLERTGSKELHSFWEATTPVENRVGDRKAAESQKDVQLFSMLSRTVADAPPDDSVFNRRFKLDRQHPLGRGAFGVVLRGKDRQRSATDPPFPSMKSIIYGLVLG